MPSTLKYIPHTCSITILDANAVNRLMSCVGSVFVIDRNKIKRWTDSFM